MNLVMLARVLSAINSQAHLVETVVSVLPLNDLRCNKPSVPVNCSPLLLYGHLQNSTVPNLRNICQIVTFVGSGWLEWVLWRSTSVVLC